MGLGWLVGWVGGSPRWIPSWGRCWGGHLFFIRVCGAISGPGFDDGLGLDCCYLGDGVRAGEGWSQVGVDAGVWFPPFFLFGCVEQLVARASMMDWDWTCEPGGLAAILYYKRLEDVPGPPCSWRMLEKVSELSGVECMGRAGHAPSLGPWACSRHYHQAQALPASRGRCI
jgi:hypothetical protein